MAAYWVDPNGDNGGIGSQADPWQTISYACNTARTSGDIIHINSGVYYITSLVDVAVGVYLTGTSGTVIYSSVGSVPTFLLESGSSNTSGNQTISFLDIRGSDPSSSYAAIRVADRGNIKIHNCSIRDFNYSGVQFYGSDYATGNEIFNCVINDCGYFRAGNEGCLSLSYQDGIQIHDNMMSTAGFDGYHGDVIKAVDGYIRNMKVYHNTLINDLVPGVTPWDFAIEIWNWEGGNEIWANTITGSIDLSGVRKGSAAYGVWVHDNVIGQPYLKEKQSVRGVLIECWVTDAIIERNYFHHVAQPIFVNALPSTEYGGDAQIHNITIRYNVADQIGAAVGQPTTGWGVYWSEDTGGATITNWKVHNNVFRAATNGADTSWGISLPDAGSADNVVVSNNIVLDFAGAPVRANDWGNPTSITNLKIQNNIFYNNGNNDDPYFVGGVSHPSDTINGNVKTAPPFVSSSDYHLTAQVTGVYIASGLTDKDGNSVNNPPSVGAFEYGGVYVPPVLVTSITVSSTTGSNTIITDKGTLQLSTVVLPTDASNNTVNWSIVSGSAYGSVNQYGQVSAFMDGVIVVRATANDGSGVYGQISITISNQAVPVLCTSLTIASAGNITEISMPNGSLQFSISQFLPADASNMTVTWSVVNGSGTGYILSSGLLVATGTGTVTVRATANDGSGIYDEMEITISNQINLYDLSLRSVCNIVLPPLDTLRNCFWTAGATLFDPTHVTGFDPRYEGNHDRLSNFINYPVTEPSLDKPDKGALYNWYAVDKYIPSYADIYGPLYNWYAISKQSLDSISNKTTYGALYNWYAIDKKSTYNGGLSDGAFYNWWAANAYSTSSPSSIVVAEGGYLLFGSFLGGILRTHAQEFLISSDCYLESISLGRGQVIGSPDFDLRLGIYSESGDLPSSQLYISSNVIHSSNWGDGDEENNKTFNFPAINLVADNYCWVLLYENVITHDVDNYIRCTARNDYAYPDGRYGYKIGEGSWILMPPIWDLNSTINIVATKTGILAPEGWHVPSLAEFQTLVEYLGGSSVAGGHLKLGGYGHWNYPNEGADNSSDFSALGTGIRTSSNPYEVNNTAHFWTSEALSLAEGGEIGGRDLSLFNSFATAGYYWSIPTVGCSIRLIKDDSNDPGSLTDYDGNVYPTVKIGNQVWMQNNLMVTHYNDGSSITFLLDDSSWDTATSEGMCWPGNNFPFIGLFAPSGWHVPTFDELFTLIEYYGWTIAGGKLKEEGFIHWNSPNTGATNESGMTLLGSGSRLGNAGVFANLKIGAEIMSSSLDNTGAPYFLVVTKDGTDSSVMSSASWLSSGRSVRLIKDDSNDPGSMTDPDGNVYQTVKIGNQVWIASNYKSTKYNNGITIPEIIDNTEWLSDTRGALCYYDNSSQDTQINIFSPTGWHVPSSAEWNTLVTYLGGDMIAGNALKESGISHWAMDTGADNSSGFTSLPAGYRYYTGEWFGVATLMAAYHSSEDYQLYNSYGLAIYGWDSTTSQMYNADDLKKYAMSVRLIKDDSNDPGYLVDPSGNVYNTVKIGDQVWITSDYRSIRYTDYSPIPFVADATAWSQDTSGAYCYPEGNSTRVHLFAPAGWHLPTEEEFFTLLTNWVNTTARANALMDVNISYWSILGGATNSSGFSARGTGLRSGSDGSFSGIMDRCSMWMALSMGLFTMDITANPNSVGEVAYGTLFTDGRSVRFIKDDSNDPGSVTDYDGNVYLTIKIGNQVWMAENFRVTHYTDGTVIPEVIDNTAWAADVAGARCWYNNANPL
jgi:uncharacterized protein (TIGR02145 family)